MKKTGKIFCAFLAVCTGATVVALAGCNDSGSEGNSTLDPNKTLNASLENVTGKAEFTLDGVYTVQTTTATSTIALGASGVEEIVLDGGEAGAVIKAVGAGFSAIGAETGGKLVLKHIQINDTTDSITASHYGQSYLEFGGKLRFENCDFTSPIYLKNDTDAEFVSCTFTSTYTDRYSVWVADGSATFTDCTFTGTRGLKIHEEGANDVETVRVSGCTFNGLTRKPGIAIGSIVRDPANTTIAIENNRFIGCQPWDQSGSAAGLDGAYECDTPLANFNFTYTEDNRVIDE